MRKYLERRRMLADEEAETARIRASLEEKLRDYDPDADKQPAGLFGVTPLVDEPAEADRDLCSARTTLATKGTRTIGDRTIGDGVKFKMTTRGGDGEEVEDLSATIDMSKYLGKSEGISVDVENDDPDAATVEAVRQTIDDYWSGRTSDDIWGREPK